MSSSIVQCLVWCPSSIAPNADTMTREQARAFVDNVRYLWDDERDALIWRGPPAELQSQVEEPTL